MVVVDGSGYAHYHCYNLGWWWSWVVVVMVGGLSGLHSKYSLK